MKIWKLNSVQTLARKRIGPAFIQAFCEAVLYRGRSRHLLQLEWSRDCPQPGTGSKHLARTGIRRKRVFHDWK